jgi:hypothetical protein
VPQALGLGLPSLPAKVLAANDAQTILNIVAIADARQHRRRTDGRLSGPVTKRNVLDAA